MSDRQSAKVIDIASHIREKACEDDLDLRYQEDWNLELKQEEIKKIALSDFPEHGVTNIRNEEWKRQHKTTGHKLLYMALIALCGGRRNYCLTTHEILANMTLLGVATIKRYLIDLSSSVDQHGFPVDPLLRITRHQYKNINRYELTQFTPINWSKSKGMWRDKREQNY